MLIMNWTEPTFWNLDVDLTWKRCQWRQRQFFIYYKHPTKPHKSLKANIKNGKIDEIADVVACSVKWRHSSDSTLCVLVFLLTYSVLRRESDNDNEK